LALEPIISTDERSLVASYVRLGKIAGAIVSADDVARML
jgi:hypothetical protein